MCTKLRKLRHGLGYCDAKGPSEERQRSFAFVVVVLFVVINGGRNPASMKVGFMNAL